MRYLSMRRLLQLCALGVLSTLSACAQPTKNSAPVSLMPAAPAQPGNETLILASGCFWGTEYFLKRIDGVVATTVGYTGGHVENPSYQEVCTKKTGHYEACLVDTPVAVPEQPLEVLRTVHSFDPCLACAVHVRMRLKAAGKEAVAADVARRAIEIGAAADPVPAPKP